MEPFDYPNGVVPVATESAGGPVHQATGNVAKAIAQQASRASDRVEQAVSSYRSTMLKMLVLVEDLQGDIEGAMVYEGKDVDAARVPKIAELSALQLKLFEQGTELREEIAVWAPLAERDIEYCMNAESEAI